MLNDFIKSKIQEHASGEYPDECCGLIVNKEGFISVVPCINTGENRQKHFILSYIDYLKASKYGKIIAFYHSQESDDPSILDKINCKGHNLPSIIYSWKNNKFFELWPDSKLTKIEQLYVGKDFIIGKQDCYTLAQEYYKNELNIELRNYKRNNDWFEKNSKLLSDNFKKEDFIIIELKNITLHDCLLFSFDNNIPSHIGIYLGNNLFLHHPRDKKSLIEFLSNSWKKRILYTVRHKNLN